MSAQLKLEGILELKAELARLPAELKGKATAIVIDAAQAAKDEIVEAYPIGPGDGEKYHGGNLRKGVRVVVKEIGPFGVAAQVRSQAPHAHLWEFGTIGRYYYTKATGARKYIGRMPAPPRPNFIPAMMRHRRAMYVKLAALLEAAGLTVHKAA